MEEAGIIDMFEYIAGREIPFSPERIKPNSYPINKAVDMMKASKSASTWYVGDSVVDAKAASQVGITAIGVCTGSYSEERLKESGASVVLKSFADIPSFLDGIER